MTERIGYNPYFYSYPQYLSSNLGVNNRFSPNFRGDGVGVATPQLTVNYTTPPDTVEISAGNKINEASTQEKQKTGMSTGAKIGLGILGTAAAAYGCIVGHRMINKPSIEKVAKNFSEIFRREIGTDEAQKMVNNYKELLEIKDTEEFCKKAFEQVKKDYGYENLPIKLNLEYLPDKGFKTMISNKVGASWCDTEGTVTLHIPDVKNGAPLAKYSKSEMIRNLIHEFQHAKQTEYACRTSLPKYIEAIKKNCSIDVENELKRIDYILKNEYDLKKYAEKNKLSIQEAKEKLKKMKELFIKHKDEISKIKTEVINTKYDERVLNELFGKYEKFAPNSKEYALGLKYIENASNYISGKIDKKRYYEQILEKEAHQTGKNFDQIYNHFANPWRIF